jgi:thiamine-phosphate pyrophosphorylase
VALITRRGLLSGAALESRLEALAAAGLAMVQVREKDLAGGALLGLCRRLRDVIRKAAGEGCRLLVNGRLDVALAAGADGVHLPARGLPAAPLRSLAPPGFLIGVSTHTPEEVRAAARSGADYALFGPVFATASHPGAPGVGRDGLAAALAAAGPLPLWAVGGIAPDTVAGLEGLPLAGVAAIRSLLAAPDPAAALAALAGRPTSRS